MYVRQPGRCRGRRFERTVQKTDVTEAVPIKIYALVKQDAEVFIPQQQVIILFVWRLNTSQYHYFVNVCATVDIICLVSQKDTQPPTLFSAHP